jgi:hypothetical protein
MADVGQRPSHCRLLEKIDEALAHRGEADVCPQALEFS